MKITVVLLFMLLYNCSIWAEFKFGRIEPNGYRMYIYSETLSTDIFLTPSQNLLKEAPTEDAFNILFKPNQEITLEIERDDNRIKNYFEYSYEPSDLFNTRFINIFSSDLYPDINSNEFSLIHHGLLLKRSGILSSELLVINSFSEMAKSGYKATLYNDLNLYNLELINILESRNFYITPFNKIHSNGKSSRLLMDLTLSDFFSIGYKNELDLDDEGILTKENSTSLKFDTLSTQITLNGGIKAITKKEFSYGADIINNFSIIENEINLKIRYINANLYYFSNTLTITPFPNLELSAKYNYTLLEEREEEYILKVEYESDTTGFKLEYSSPINAIENSWDLNASIYYSDY